MGAVHIWPCMQATMFYVLGSYSKPVEKTQGWGDVVGIARLKKKLLNQLQGLGDTQGKICEK